MQRITVTDLTSENSVTGDPEDVALWVSSLYAGHVSTTDTEFAAILSRLLDDLVRGQAKEADLAYLDLTLELA
jgi:N-dimethylarginine dimethylaminohydrolase